jgi:cation diffusion facilitator CzcD-associated flavoprotein CzcO
MFPPQEEILNYLSTVVQQYCVNQHFTGGVEWTGATWHEKTQTWSVTLQDIQTNEVFTQECQILISAVGGLVNPQELKIPGAEQFQGEIIHTAKWKTGFDLTNKRVAVIGNGGKCPILLHFTPKAVTKRDSIRGTISPSNNPRSKFSYTVYEG